MEKNKQYFDRPKQVVFADPDNAGEWIVGIAYKDEIICACCGSIFDIDDVIDQAAADGVMNPIYSYEDWNDISCEITGGELPDGLMVVDDGVMECITPTADEVALTDEDATEAEIAVFTNTWVDGVAMPSIDE